MDDFTDLSSGLNAPIKEYDPEDDMRICKSIVLSGKDLTEMKDAEWNQVVMLSSNLIAVMSVRRNCVRKNNTGTKTSDCEGISKEKECCCNDRMILDSHTDDRVMESMMLPV